MSEIVVGIDDSPGAQDALAFAARVAATTGASLRLASAFPYSDVPSRARTRRTASICAATRRRCSTARRRPSKASRQRPRRSPTRRRRTRCMSSPSGRTPRWWSSARRITGRSAASCPGSTGERLLHGSPCPVAIVPRGYADAGPIGTVGVGYDGSDESEAALAAACQVARRFDAALRVIRVFDATAFGAPALMTVPGYADRARGLRGPAARGASTRPSRPCLADVQRRGRFRGRAAPATSWPPSPSGST